MKETFFRNWYFMRWIRLAFALFLFYQAFLLKEWMFVVFGLFFTIQVIFNIGCSSNGCTIPYTKNNNDE